MTLADYTHAHTLVALVVLAVVGATWLTIDFRREIRDHREWKNGRKP